MHAFRKRGAYEADRASALAGVPESTLYLWARSGLIIPSVSPDKLKLWSWSDLIAARAVYWLRHPPGPSGRRPTKMADVRELLRHVDQSALSLGESLAGHELRLWVDASGVPHIQVEDTITEGRHRYRQAVASDLVIDLLAEFSGEGGAIGPDLRHPRPFIEISPGVLSGQPHLAGTRIETRVIRALAKRGYRIDELLVLYPGASKSAISNALSLERRLEKNTRRLAA